MTDKSKKKTSRERIAWDITKQRNVICTHPTYCIPSFPVGEKMEVYSRKPSPKELEEVRRDSSHTEGGRR